MLWVQILIRVRCTTLCDKVCQWLVTGQWFSRGTPVSETTDTASFSPGLVACFSDEDDVSGNQNNYYWPLHSESIARCKHHMQEKLVYCCTCFRHGHDRMEVGFTITYAISAYHHWCYEFKSWSRRGVFNTTLCEKVCPWLRQVGGFLRVLRFPAPIKNWPSHVTEIWLKMALNTITIIYIPCSHSKSISC
jgi:hypothetical protein